MLICNSKSYKHKILAYYDEILFGKKDLKDILARILKLRNLELKKDHTLEGLAGKMMDVLKEFDERTKMKA